MVGLTEGMWGQKRRDSSRIQIEHPRARVLGQQRARGIIGYGITMKSNLDLVNECDV
jgi:hypothetical protein